MTDSTKKVHRGSGRVAFLARLADFQRLLDAGHPMRAIYDDYGDELGIGYPQFTKYVGRYVRKSDHDRHENQAPGGEVQTGQSPSPPTQGEGRNEPATKPGGATSGAAAKPGTKPGDKFIHDANSGNNRDDLI
ncbi:MAG: TraK family protein [Sphingobium sp.]